MWSFVDNKGNKQWLWLALDANTREIVGVDIGARDEAAAHQLWQSLLPLDRQFALVYTDFWTSYAAILPSKPHRAVGKETGKTSYPIAFQQYLKATSVSLSPKHLVLL
jgi:insertion element IS1 protein InsB